MAIIIFSFAVGLALIAWGIRLWTYKHSADYTEGTVTVEGRVFKIDVADTMEKRAAGLSGRGRLRDDEAMLFIFPTAGKYGFWMKDMKFDLDIVWIAAGRAVGVAENVPAPKAGESALNLPSYNPPEPVDTVLEINAGLAARYGIGTGDAVKFNLR